MYYKITNQHENHLGFQYKDGLNAFTDPFDDNPNHSYGGLYFTTLEHISDFYENGIYIREVFLPTDNPNFKMVKDKNNTWRANMIILGKRYELYDIATFKLFNIPVTTYLVELAAAFGRTDVLDLFFDSYDVDFDYVTDAINNAAKNGYINVLEWFNIHDVYFNYNEYAIDWAAMNGHINVLEWFKNNDYEFKYTCNAINLAAKNGHIHVLEWFKNNEYELKYTEYAINWTVMSGNFDILEWFKYNNLEFKFHQWMLDMASDDMKEWFSENGLY